MHLLHLRPEGDGEALLQRHHLRLRGHREAGLGAREGADRDVVGGFELLVHRHHPAPELPVLLLVEAGDLALVLGLQQLLLVDLVRGEGVHVVLGHPGPAARVLVAGGGGDGLGHLAAVPRLHVGQLEVALPGHGLHHRGVVGLQLQQRHGQRRVDQVVVHISKHLTK